MNKFILKQFMNYTLIFTRKEKALPKLWVSEKVTRKFV